MFLHDVTEWPFLCYLAFLLTRRKPGFLPVISASVVSLVHVFLQHFGFLPNYCIYCFLLTLLNSPKKHLLLFILAVYIYVRICMASGLETVALWSFHSLAKSCLCLPESYRPGSWMLRRVNSHDESGETWNCLESFSTHSASSQQNWLSRCSQSCALV